MTYVARANVTDKTVTYAFWYETPGLLNPLLALTLFP